MSRFEGFTQVELDAIRDGLLGETELEPTEDPSFPSRIRIAQDLVNEIDLDAL